MYDLDAYYQTLREGRSLGSSARRVRRPTIAEHHKAVRDGEPVSAATHVLIPEDTKQYVSAGADRMLWSHNFGPDPNRPQCDRADNTMPPLPDLPDWLTEDWGKARKKTT